jgi:hypothetical protein
MGYKGREISGIAEKKDFGIFEEKIKGAFLQFVWLGLRKWEYNFLMVNP